MVAQLPCKQKVAGSSPVSSSIKFLGDIYMKKKFMLRSGYGGFVPDVLTPFLNKRNFPDNRTGEIIDYIEHSAVVIKNINNIAELCEKNKTTIYKIRQIEKGEEIINEYVGWCSKIDGYADFEVVEYNTSVKNLFATYDGSESITPLQCIDNDLNLWK